MSAPQEAAAAAATPGQAARHAYGAEVARALGMDWPGPAVDITGPGGDPVFAAGWEAAVEAVADLLSKGWPKCPDGCGCRLGTTGPDGENDADARDCACDGPCCMECSENGYIGPSYRDIAVRDITGERDALQAERDQLHAELAAARNALGEARQHRDAYRALASDMLAITATFHVSAAQHQRWQAQFRSVGADTDAREALGDGGT